MKLTGNKVVFSLWADAESKVRLRVKSRNGRILMTTEGYEKRAGALNAIRTIIEAIETGAYKTEWDEGKK